MAHYTFSPLNMQTFITYTFTNTITQDMDLPNLYDICDPVHKPRILIIVHHKTGTHLFRQFFTVLQKYYRQKCNLTLEIGAGEWIHFFPDGIGRLEYFMSIFDLDKYKTWIIIHSIRGPVEIILSAYNYHKSMTKESEHVDHSYDSAKQLKELSKKESYNFWHKVHCYNHFFFEDKSPLKIEEVFHHNYTIKSVLNNNYDLSMGLEYEFQRFSCYDWVDITKAYQLLTQIQANVSKIELNVADENGRVQVLLSQKLRKGRENGGNVIVEQVSMEQFKEGFNLTVSRILNAFGIRNKTDRNMLMDGFVRFDTNSLSAHQYGALMAGHITEGTYDKIGQTKILLGEDKERCRTLKVMTYALQLSWKYPEYC